MGRADACRNPGSISHLSQATHRDTPPEDVQWPGQVSWLAGRRCCLAFPTPYQGVSDTLRQQLAAYSCGGSAGIEPASLLARHLKVDGGNLGI